MQTYLLMKYIIRITGNSDTTYASLHTRISELIRSISKRNLENFQEIRNDSKAVFSMMQKFVVNID